MAKVWCAGSIIIQGPCRSKGREEDVRETNCSHGGIELAAVRQAASLTLQVQ